MKLPPHRVKIQPVRFVDYYLSGGPLNGATLSMELQIDGPNYTLPIVCRGEVGRYNRGKWEPDVVATSKLLAETLGYPTL